MSKVKSTPDDESQVNTSCQKSTTLVKSQHLGSKVDTSVRHSCREREGTRQHHRAKVNAIDFLTKVNAVDILTKVKADHKKSTLRAGPPRGWARFFFFTLRVRRTLCITRRAEKRPAPPLTRSPQAGPVPPPAFRSTLITNSWPPFRLNAVETPQPHPLEWMSAPASSSILTTPSCRSPPRDGELSSQFLPVQPVPLPRAK